MHSNVIWRNKKKVNNMHPDKEEVESFKALARKVLARCGNKWQISVEYVFINGEKLPPRCEGCPAFGVDGEGLQACVYDKALSI